MSDESTAVTRIIPASGVSSSRVKSALHTATLTGVFLRKQIWLWPIIAAIVLAAIGWPMRNALEGRMKTSLAANLQTLLDADVAALRYWMKSQETLARSIAVTPSLIAPSERIVAQADGAANPQLELLQSPDLVAIREALRPAITAYHFDGFVVVSPGGRIAASQHSELIGMESFFAKESLKKVLAGESTIDKPYLSRAMLRAADGTMRPGVPTMFVFTPLRNADGKPFAALGLRIRPEIDFTQILSIGRAGETGETYAFDRDGLLLSQSRFDDQLRAIGLLTDDAESILRVAVRDPQVDLTRNERTTLRRAEQPLTLMAAEAVAGRKGVNVAGYRDYRGVPVVGAWTWLDDYDFGVANEQDVAEAFATLYVLRTVFWTLFGLLFAAAVAIFIFSVVVARLQTEARRATIKAKQLGQYSLDEKLGEGGMGIVYRAHHAMLQRPTAVKLLHADKTNEQTTARFEREVQLTAKLNHPNTIAIYDYGRTPDGVFYYAMEYLDGIDLERLVKQFGPQPDGRVVHILQQVCGSLAEAHALGMIHRDVKPANILLSERGGICDFVKVLDFGLAKALESDGQATATLAGSLTGTPLYLSPEAIAHSDSIDARSDLYALGAVGYYLLAGVPVFDTVNVVELIHKHMTEMPQPPSVRSGRPISPEVEAIIMRCLAKRPDDRPRTAVELAADLERCSVMTPWTEGDARPWWQAFRPQSPFFSSPATTQEHMLATTVELPAKKSPTRA